MPESKPFDFSLFSDRQLLDLAYQVRMEVARRQQKRRVMARSRGHLTDAGGPRYRNPDNPAETWSGQGRPPAWVREALAAGDDLEVFEASDSD